jgi:HK97 family phage major capsid protein
VSYIDRQIEMRQHAWEEAKALLDSAEAEKRDLSAEEQEKYDRISADLSERAAVIAKMRADEEREAKFAAATSHIETQVRVEQSLRNPDEEKVRALVNGDIRSAIFEHRDVTTASTGAPVPTSFYDQIVRHMVVAGPMLETSTMIRTTGGEKLQIPRSSAYSTAGLTPEGSAFAESDPTFQAFLELDAYKYGFLVQVAREMVEDSGIDLLGFLSEQAGIAIGVAVNTALTTGSGSSAPTGIVTAAGTGVTGSTAVSGAFTADNLIDLSYSVNSAYRRMPGTGWAMTGATIAAVRKLKDTTNQYLFQPSLQAGQPDQLLGYPIYENPDVAAVATSAKSVVFGNLRSYYVRMAGGIRFDRSDDYAFANDLITFKAAVRLDGGLPQQGAVNVFRGGTA